MKVHTSATSAEKNCNTAVSVVMWVPEDDVPIAVVLW